MSWLFYNLLHHPQPVIQPCTKQYWVGPAPSPPQGGGQQKLEEKWCHHLTSPPCDYLGWVVTTGQGEYGWSTWIAGSGSWWGWPDAIVWWPDAIVRSTSLSLQLALGLGLRLRVGLLEFALTWEPQVSHRTLGSTWDLRLSVGVLGFP